MFLMMKINKPKHAITTDFHDFPFLPKPSISSMQHIFCSTCRYMSFCQGHLAEKYPVPWGLGLVDPFVKGHLLTQSCSQKQLLPTANAEALGISGTLCHTVLGH